MSTQPDEIERLRVALEEALRDKYRVISELTSARFRIAELEEAAAKAICTCGPMEYCHLMGCRGATGQPSAEQAQP